MVTEKALSYKWHDTSAGQLLIEAEKHELDNLLPRLYGYHILQIGDPVFANFLNSSLISHRMSLNNEGLTKIDFSVIKAEFGKLPLQSDSVDVVVLTHSLEQVKNPHQVLREAYRILIPEGHIIITGFNPISLCGLWMLFKQLFQKHPKKGKLLGNWRVRDWLKLLDFQLVGGQKFYFRPPLSNTKVMQKLAFLDKIGAKLWPFFGGAYTLMAVKRVGTITPVKPKWRRRQSDDLWGETEGIARTPLPFKDNQEV